MISNELKTAIYESLGTASMCWSEAPKGVFDSTEAAKIGDTLVEKISKEFVSRTVTDAIKNDPDLYIAYQANIAMAFKDEMERAGIHLPNESNHSILVTRDMLHIIANQAAKNFIDLWCK